MYIEIDRATNASDLSALQNGLLAALDTVRATVQDFSAMRERVQALISQLNSRRKQYFSRDERAEAVAFLEWLLDDHFTFLGYECFAINEGHAPIRSELLLQSLRVGKEIARQGHAWFVECLWWSSRSMRSRVWFVECRR